MAWYDTQTGADTITHTEWNNMVTWIRTGDVTAQTTSPKTLDLSDNIVVCDTTGGAIAITLPEANSSLGKRYVIFMETDGGTNVTVTCAGADTISGANTIATLADAEDCIEIVAVSADRWLVLENIGSVTFS
jgi:hypothetical protein